MWRVLALSVATLCLCAATATQVKNLGGHVYLGMDGDDVVGRYYHIQTPLSWSDAYKACMDRDSQPAVINSKAEADVIMELIGLDNVINTVWIGMHDRFEEGDYVTLQDDELWAVGYRTWHVGYPMGGTTRNCVAAEVKTNSPTILGLVDLPCTDLHQTFCEERLWSDYDKVLDHGFYKYHPELVTWPEAWDACRQEGARLVIINSAAELDMLLERYDHTYAWVGVNHVFASGEFISVLNDPLEILGYDTWGSFPNLDNVNYPYVSIYRNWGLFSEPKERTLSFICEHRMV